MPKTILVIPWMKRPGTFSQASGPEKRLPDNVFLGGSADSGKNTLTFFCTLVWLWLLEERGLLIGDWCSLFFFPLV